MTVVHIQTTIQTILGVLDDNGNIIQKQPVNVEVSVLSTEAFAESARAIIKARDDFQEQINKNK
jgi:hypothetical protein